MASSYNVDEEEPRALDNLYPNLQPQLHYSSCSYPYTIILTFLLLSLYLSTLCCPQQQHRKSNQSYMSSLFHLILLCLFSISVVVHIVLPGIQPVLLIYNTSKISPFSQRNGKETFSINCMIPRHASLCSFFMARALFVLCQHTMS